MASSGDKSAENKLPPGPKPLLWSELRLQATKLNYLQQLASDLQSILDSDQKKKEKIDQEVSELSKLQSGLDPTVSRYRKKLRKNKSKFKKLESALESLKEASKNNSNRLQKIKEDIVSMDLKYHVQHIHSTRDMPVLILMLADLTLIRFVVEKRVQLWFEAGASITKTVGDLISMEAQRLGFPEICSSYCYKVENGVIVVEGARVGYGRKNERRRALLAKTPHMQERTTQEEDA